MIIASGWRSDAFRAYSTTETLSADVLPLPAPQFTAM